MITTLLNLKARPPLKVAPLWAQLLCIFLLSGLPLESHAEATTPIVSTVSSAEKPPLDKVRLQLKWFHQFQFAGYYAAIEQGYFAEEGLDVELIERDLNKSVINQVISGKAEYGVGDSGLLHEYALGKPIVAMAAIFQHNPLVFMTRRDSGIISPFEMKGKRIMLDTLNANEAPLKALLAHSKLSDNDYTLIKQSGDNSLLAQGKLDVMTGYSTDETYYYKEHNIPINVINPQNYGIDFYGDILFTSQDERQQHPERIDRFLRASLKGWRYALDHPDTLITLIADRYHSKLSLAHLQFEAQETKKLIPNTVPLGYIDLDRIKVIAESYVKAGYNQSIDSIKLNHFIYQRAANDIQLSEAEKRWLANHPVIRVGVNPNKQPYDWVDEQGEFVGMGADYLKLLEQKIGVHFTIVNPGSLAGSLELIKRGDIDMLAGVVITEERSQFLSFLNPYVNSPNIIVNTDTHYINSLEKLEGKVVAVEKSYAIQEWLKRDYPAIKLVEAKDALAALRLVEAGKAEAYVGDIASTNYWIKKEDLSHLRISGETNYRSERSIAISKQLPELTSIMNKASLMIDPKQIDDIPHHWFNFHVDSSISKATIQKYAMVVGGLLLVFIYWIVRLSREIKLRHRYENKERRRNNVLNMLTNHQSLSDILSSLCSDIEKLDADMACSILLLSDDGKTLTHGAAPSLPDFYCQAIDGVVVGPQVGSCGASAFTGESMFVSDILTHTNWRAFNELVVKLPYRACWSQAIKTNAGEVLGTFAIYYRKTKMPTSQALQLINEASHLAGDVIEKSRLDMKTQLAAKVYDFAREGIYITDKRGNIIDCNDAFLAVSGYSREELLGKNPRIFKSGVHDDAFYSRMWEAILTEGFWTGEIWNKYKARDKSPGLHSITVIRNANNEIERFLAITSDISELKRHQHQLELFAYNDALTGLPNRLLLTDRLNQLILQSNREYQNLVVAFIDLDGFKEINDHYGHAIGDEFLIGISNKMRNVMRESDTLGRLGGDEFIFILNHQADAHTFHQPIEKLMAVCNSPIEMGNLTLKVTASIGVSYYEGHPKRHIDANTLIRQADQAMYSAKQAGKNTYHVFNDNTDHINNTREEFVKQIQLAIHANDFVLYYQPKVNMRTGELLGVEALIRWNHPHSGLLLPDQFLPMIANHPVSVELGNWVIEKALMQIDRWQTSGLNIPISINIDAKHLSYYNFIELLRSALAAYPHYRPGSLEIEILETSAFSSREQAALLISECKKLGVGFSLDDFGTGYSSLTYLKSLPIEIIKIDRSFVKDIMQNMDDLAIVDSVISLGGFMGRKVIAEGVETIEVGELLIKHGCDYAQGYAIAKPMPADELLDWKAQWRPSPSWLNA